MAERLQKILSRAGAASRRAAERLMAEGRVTLNGEVVRELGTRADAATDDVRVDGVRVRAAAEPVYLLLNKPRGFVTTRSDPSGRPTVMGLVPPVPGLFPVGRLDLGTEGLLLLTNDGAFAERVAHPRYEIPRVYLAKVHGVPDPETLARLRSGVRVEGERLTADRVRLVQADNNAWLEVTLHEGRQHEVKRLLGAVGHPVSKLRRVAIGPLTDKGLPVGSCRPLTEREVRALLAGGEAVQPRREQGRAERRLASRRPARTVVGAEGRRQRPSSASGQRTRRPQVRRG